jgi:hypothetical protein
MNRWQPREAAWRAAKTFIQTFAGALTGVTLTFDASALQTFAMAGFSATVAALMAFAMNLEASAPAEPVEVTITDEPVEVTTEKPKKKARR